MKNRIPGGLPAGSATLVRTIAGACVVVAGGVLSPAALAQSPAGASTFFLRLGANFSTIDTRIRADGTNGLTGTQISFERDLGFDDNKTLPTVDLAWRFAQRHRLELNYLELSRSNSAKIDRSFNWQGQVYPINTTVNADFSSRVTALTYLYSIVKTPDTELSAGLGVHGIRLSASIAAEGTSLASSGSVSGLAPLPVVALRGATRIAGNVSAEVRYQWFGIKSGDYDGNLHVVNAAVAWYPWPRVGFEAGYNYNHYSLGVDKSNWNGEARYEFKGPSLSVVAAF
jgi:hypothetical protein